MTESRIEKAMDGLLEWGFFLPMTLAQRSHSKLIRFIGLIAYIAWMPMFIVFGIPYIILLFAFFVEETMNG